MKIVVICGRVPDDDNQLWTGQSKLDEVLRANPNASIKWLQSSAAYSYRTNHLLTAIVEV